MAAIVVERVRERKMRSFSGEDGRIYLALAVSGLTPFALFELWRLTTLGLAGFIWNWRQHLAFVRSQGITSDSVVSVFDVVAQRVRLADENFLVGLPIAFALGVLSFYLTRLAASPATVRAARLMAYGLTLHALYWLVASNGWPRYLYIAVVLWCFLIALPLLSGPWLCSGAAYLVALAIAVVPALPHFNVFTTVRAAAASTLPIANEADRQVIQFLDKHAGLEPVYTSWWAHIAAQELLPAGLRDFRAGL